MAMSDRRRAFLALQGEQFPLVGKRGWWEGPRIDTSRRSPRRAVEVVRLSASGRTVWTRFVTAEARRIFGAGSHRWWLVGRNEHNIAYCSFGNELYGTVYF